MEKMQYTLTMYIGKFESLFMENKKLLKNMYTQLIKKMLNAKIVNSDLHFGNIMINFNSKGKPIKMRSIDWGIVKSTENTLGVWSVGKLLKDWDYELRFELKNKD